MAENEYDIPEMQTITEYMNTYTAPAPLTVQLKYPLTRFLDVKTFAVELLCAKFGRSTKIVSSLYFVILSHSPPLLRGSLLCERDV
jgi:hypothetical protein